MNTRDTIATMRAIGALDEGGAMFGFGWNIVNVARGHFKNRPPTTAAWLGAGRDWPGVTPPNFWKESTFDDCVGWLLVVPKAPACHPFLRITFWDGDTVTGAPTEYRRCEWEWVLTDADDPLCHWLHPKLMQMVEDKVRMDMSREAEERQRAEIERRMNAYLAVAKKEML